MKRQLGTVMAGAWAALALCAPAAAATQRDNAFIVAAEAADAPQGFVEMCARDTALCRAGIAPALATTPVARMPGGWPPLLVAPCWRDAAMRPASLHAAVMVDQAACLAPMASAAPAVVALAAASAPSHPVGLAPMLTRGTGALDARVRLGGGRDIGVGAGGDALRQLRTINRVVNMSAAQVPDAALYGNDEYWTRAGAGAHPAGDCEDLAIEKRMRLIAAGFPPQHLFYAVVYRAGLGLHTILIARLDDGDYVLDSAAPGVRRWSKSHYVWLRVQSADDPLVWRRVATDRTAQLAGLDTATHHG